MGLFKQLMVFGKTGLQGPPTRVTLSLWAFSRQGATGGVPLFTTWDPVVGSGRVPIPGNISGRSQTQAQYSGLSHLGLGQPRDRDLKENWFLLFSN